MELWSVVRWVRAAGFTAACAGLAAAGHVFGGGAVDRGALATGLALMFVPALALTGRERTMRTILPAVAASQVLMHALMPETVTRTAVPAGHAGHDGSPGLGMLLMHAVAVLITAWWLERGEAGLCALVRQVAGWVLRPLRLERPAPIAPRAVLVPAHPVCDGLRLVVLRHVVARRGPPAGTVALG